jgi:hypothetical protein
VDARLEAHARHADRLADPFLPVDDEFLRQDVENLLVGRIGTACAASITRATSPPTTSLSLIATMPCELRLRTWLPAIPVNTERISTPAMSSASSIARWIDWTVESMLTTTPFLRPREGCDRGR